MITDFNELRKSIESSSDGRPTLRDQLNDEKDRQRRMEYAKTMALIQIAQELNEIKVALTEGKILE